jgi:uncharacterized membrane protein YhaH (DUF805 family)
MMEWLHLLFSPQGRIRRRDFWVGFSIVLAASLTVNVIPVVGQPLGLLILWPQVAVHAKRLHDMGRTAWLQLIPFAVSIAAGTYATLNGGEALLQALTTNDQAAFQTAVLAGGPAVAAIAAAVVFGLAFLLWVGLSRGTKGENKYGPEPRSILSADPSSRAG